MVGVNEGSKVGSNVGSQEGSMVGTAIGFAVLIVLSKQSIIKKINDKKKLLSKSNYIYFALTGPIEWGLFDGRTEGLTEGRNGLGRAVVSTG